MGEEHGFLFQAFVYLAAAVLSVPVAKRLGLGSVLGYLVAGVIIGPYLLGLVGSEGQDVLHFAEFGVVLMLFLIGLELRPGRLWRLRGPILGLGGLQVLLTSIVLSLAGMALGLPWQAAVAIGMTLSLSSTAIVLQNLNERGLLKSAAGQSTFSVLLFQDIAVIPMLAVMPFLGSGGESGAESQPAWLSTLLVLGMVAGIILMGRYLVRPAFRFIAATRMQEVFTAAALLLVVGIALGMDQVGLSPALGTFLAGVVLAENEYRHELESSIEPFKGLLLGLFFIAVGASIDFRLLFEQAGLIAALVVGLMLVKGFIILWLARAFGMVRRSRWLAALALAQGGEFAFVLFSYATANRVLGTELANLLVLVVAMSMLLSPLLLIAWERLVRPMDEDDGGAGDSEPMPDEPDPVIIAGFGRFGQIVSRLLDANGIRPILLDHDAGQIDLTRRFGNKVFYGDASRIDLLRAAGAENARLLILCLDDQAATLRAVREIRKHFPDLPLLVRAFDRRHTYDLMRLGAENIVRETFGSALDMGAEALIKLGWRPNQAFRASRLFRRYDQQSLAELFEYWGDDQAYGVRVRQRNEDLERLLTSDHQRRTAPLDSDWERPAED